MFNLGMGNSVHLKTPVFEWGIFKEPAVNHRITQVEKACMIIESKCKLPSHH